MAIDKETNKAVGGGGGTYIESTDQSISITETEPGEKDLSVNWDKMPLVTEDENGKARAFDKVILDHSLQNSAQFGMRADEDAAMDHIVSEDPQYAPRLGQMLTWQDDGGEYKLSRYSYDTKFKLPIKTQWAYSVYDDVHDTICCLSFGEPTGALQGNFTAATRRVRGTWQVVEYPNFERWFQLCYGNGTIVALSGNRSKEIMVSVDGGFNWELYTLPGETYWKRVRYHGGRFYFINDNAYYETEDFQNYTNQSVYGARILDLTWKNDNIILLYKKATGADGANEIYIDDTADGGNEKKIPQIFAGYWADLINSFVYVCNNIYTFFSAFGYSATDPDDGLKKYSQVSVNITTGQCRVENGGQGINSYKGVQDIVAVQDKNNPDNGTIYVFGEKIGNLDQPIYKETFDVNTFPGATNVEATIRSDVSTHGCIVRGDYVFLMKGASQNGGWADSDYNADETWILDADTLEETTINFSPWEQIPLIKEEAEGIVGVENKKTYNVSVEKPFLQFKNKTLSANASDRTTEYSNYRLTRGDLEIWCIAERNDIVDNTTKVYADEECTDEIGVITNHNYNINNPNDTEVLIDGETLVFTFIDSKIPVFLATTAAIIEALKKKVDVGNAIYFKANGTGPWVAVIYTWNTDHYEAAPATNPGFIVAITTDGQEPANDLSNIYAVYQWTAGSSFGIRAAANFTTEAHGDAPIYIEL